MRRSPHVAAIAVLLASACAEPSEPRPRAAASPEPGQAAPAPKPAPGQQTPAPVSRRAGSPDREPEPDAAFEAGPEPASWAFYPAVDPLLREALADGERADALLEALVRTLAPYRWNGVEDWDHLGFIRTADDAPRGFVTRVDGALQMQPPGSYSLGCAGGFLEGLRVTLTPAIEMEDLRRCDEDTLATLGPLAPATCEPEAFGLHAIANAARAAESAGLLSEPPVPLRIEPHDPKALGPLARPGALQLCTVSHEPTVGPRTRLHHHLMIVMRATGPRALMLFDTTGFRGVAMRRIDPPVLSRYVTQALARNDEHRYDPASARLDCFTVERRR